VLANAEGLTKGSPYVTIFGAGKLAPGASASVKLKFNAPESGGLNYSLDTVVNAGAL
jgi:hypothetical protein